MFYFHITKRYFYKADLLIIFLLLDLYTFTQNQKIIKCIEIHTSFFNKKFKNTAFAYNFGLLDKKNY